LNPNSGTPKGQVPIADRLFTWPAEEPRLIGTRCLACGEAFFPVQPACSFCSSTDVEEIAFSRRGTLDYYTCTHYPTPGYPGPVPLCVGFVRLPEGTKILAPLTEQDISKLNTGMELELVIRPVGTDGEGNELLGFAFKPV
jgi:uncharacterized OB-fold protein